MSPGKPPPQYYIGNISTATRLAQSTDGGLFHGPDVAPAIKYLKNTLVITSTGTALPMSLWLLDYLMFYAFNDEGTTEVQPMINTVNGTPVTLPRYPTGEGVQIMAISVAGRTGGQSFQVGYTNSAGVEGRMTMPVIETTAQATGNIVSSSVASNLGSVFLPLQAGDSGVRKIDSFTMLGLDVGLVTLVLVKPLAWTQLVNILAPAEKDYLWHSSIFPDIKPDAYLNFICQPNGTLAATALIGNLKVIWN
jgi:hypothetical protein